MLVATLLQRVERSAESKYVFRDIDRFMVKRRTVESGLDYLCNDERNKRFVQALSQDTQPRHAINFQHKIQEGLIGGVR
jgi:hypothetical protein